MKVLFKYLVSGAFWRNLLYAIGVATLIFLITFLSFRIYTHHGRSNAVPDFTNMSIEEAIPLIDKQNLRYEILDSLYVASQEPGVIIEQHPKPDFLVKKNRKIFLTINSSGPEKILMPNLVGVTLREGKSRLISSGLFPGKLSYRYDISKNVILEQRFDDVVLESGDSITKGSSIELVLGKGLGNEKAMAPDLIGLTVEEALAKVGNKMFSIGAVVPDGTVHENTDTIPARIFRQRPVNSPDVLIALGSTISVWTTNDTTKLPQSEKVEEDQLIWPEANDEYETDTSILITN